ncbi:MAG: hypothetical protein EBV06_16255, partial [Planctomycetia bacterium]|nr:hypothetical protein [Planctomycetia bacterium]
MDSWPIKGSFRIKVETDGMGIPIDAKLDLGPLGQATAFGRVELSLEGVLAGMSVQFDLPAFRGAGVDFQAEAELAVNTTNKNRTIRSKVDPAAEPINIPAKTSQLLAAGRMGLHVPDGNDDNQFGTELFVLQGAFSFVINSQGLQLFATAQMQIGSPDVKLFDIQASGVFVITKDGIAGDVQVTLGAGNISAITNYLTFDVGARIVFNTTSQDLNVPIASRFLPYLSNEFKSRLVPTNDPAKPYAYVIGSAPPPRPDGSQGGVGPYLVIAAQGNLTIAAIFHIQGDFHFEVSTDHGNAEMYMTAHGSMSFEPFAAAVVTGTLYIGQEGSYGSLQFGAAFGFGPLSISGAAQLEFNTFNRAVTIDRYQYDYATRRVTNQRVQATVDPNVFRVYVGGFMGIQNSFEFKGHFELVSKPDVITVSMDATFQAFDLLRLRAYGDFNIVKTNNAGLVMNVGATLSSGFFGIDGVFDMNASFQLLINTRSGYGQDGYDLGVQRGMYRVNVSGELSLLGTLTLNGSGYIQVNRGVFSMQVSMSTSFFGLANLNASGFFSSQGEFELSFSGGFTFGVPGFLGVSAGGSIYVSLLDNDGTGSLGDGNTNLTVSGSLGGTFWIFGFSVNTNITINYTTATGVLSISPSITLNFFLFSITISTTFNLGLLKVNPPIFIAGNVGDTYGQAFRGGELYLNMGSRAYLRNYDTDVINEHFEVETVGPDDDKGGYIVRVGGNSLKRTFRGVTSIYADGGSGRDFIETDSALPLPVTLRGGSGNDRIIHRGSGYAVIDGGSGDDELTGGTGLNRFVFDEANGYDIVSALSGTSILDFNGSISSLNAALTTGGAVVVSSSLSRANFGDAFVRVDDGSTINRKYAPVKVVHDGGHRLVVHHPGHPFKAGDQIEIASPDLNIGPALRSKLWTISEVTSDSYVLDIPAPLLHRGSTATIYYGNKLKFETIILHDGDHTATVYHPDHKLKVGDRISIDTDQASNYVGDFTITAVGTDYYAFDIPFSKIRDSVTARLNLSGLELGRGNDIVTTDGTQRVVATISDNSTSADEILIDGSLPSVLSLTTGRFQANNLDLSFGNGIDRLTLYQPSQSFTINGTNGLADLGSV